MSNDRVIGIRGDEAIKKPVLVATTANIALSGEQTIDGVAVVENNSNGKNDRVLVKDQTTGSENGIYNVRTGSWARSGDFDGTNDATKLTIIGVQSGTVAAGFFYQLDTVDPEIGTDSLSFSLNNLFGGGSYTFLNSGLSIQDTDASHEMTIKVGSNYTTDRILTITTGDFARTIDISAADLTLSAFGATLIDDASATAALATLGIVLGVSNTQIPQMDAVGYPAASGKQLTDIWPRNYIGGFNMSNDTDTAHDILVAAGECKSATNDADMVLAAMTKQIDATWAAGDDAGGLCDTDTVGNATWYHVFVISAATGGASDVCMAEFDTDIATTAAKVLADAAVIVAGFTKYRRLGSVLTDGSANILGFVQIGDDFLWKDPPKDYAQANPGTNEVTVALTVPLGVSVLANLNMSTASDDGVYAHHPDVDDEQSNQTTEPLATVSVNAGGGTFQAQAHIHTDTSKQIQFRQADDVAVNIVTLGWTDPRGKND